MLTDEDIKKITKAQIEAQKEVFFTKKEIDEKFYFKAEIDEKFDVVYDKLSSIQTSVDSFAKDSKDKTEEMPVINHRVKELENWVDKAAPKVGVKFSH